MSRKSQIKFAVFIVAFAIAIPIGIICVTLIAQFVTYFQQGADPASIFRGHSLFIPEPDAIRWDDNELFTGEAPTRSEKEEIISAYWLAWEALVRVQQTGDTSDMPTYWSGAAYSQAFQGINTDQLHISEHNDHTLLLNFFSEDGSVVAFRDDSFTVVQSIGDTSIALVTSADVVMTIDQGFWRIRSISLQYD